MTHQFRVAKKPKRKRCKLIRYIYSPGCGFFDYDERTCEKIHEYLNKSIGDVEFMTDCCRIGVEIPQDTVIINTCPGCDQRFGSLYEGVSTVTIWELLADMDDFPFPKRDGLKLTVHDSCPMREQPNVHSAVRKLLGKMNIEIAEAADSGENSICCGYGYKDELSDDEVHKKMKERADALPLDDVCVYCTGCLDAMTIAGKKPRHLANLLFG